MREYGRKFTKKVPDKPIPHGTINGYANYKCRCDDCKAAQSERNRKQYTPRPREPKPIQHGTLSGYGTHKCRCDDCKAAQSEYMRLRYEANTENYVERSRRWREREGSREKIAEYARRRRDDPDYRRIKCDAEQRRRALKRNAFVEDVPRLEIFNRDNWQCQIPGCLYPGEPVKLDVGRSDPLYASVDHIMPLSKGGLHERSNLATAHFRCNSTKNDRIEGIA